MYLKFTQTGTFAWGIFIAMTVTSESKYRILSLVSQRCTHICRYIVYISLYLVPDIYTTAWQAKKRCVFQYKQTKTWRASKEDSKCLTQHEKLQKDIISMYLQENYRITDIGYFYEGVCACHFTLYFWHLVNQRRFNLEIRQSTDKC